MAGLEHAQWATADMAYRREVLAAVGGFDERFPRAYREDADLGLRVVGAGWRIVRGERHVVHPVAAGPAVDLVAKQAGNADDVLMRRLHGRRLARARRRPRAGAAPPSRDGRRRGRRARRRRRRRGRQPPRVALQRRRRAAASPASPRPAPSRPARAATRLVAPRRSRRPRLVAPAPRGSSRRLGAGWLAGTAELAWARIAPGPRTAREVATMVWTSAADALRRHRVVAARRLRPPRGEAPRPRPKAVLFDRDGTLIADVPYNGDPDAGRADAERAGGARSGCARRACRTAVVSNQSGIARGLLGPDDVLAVHARMEELLGPLGPLEYCPHGPADGCACRKPAPGLILRAAARLGVDPRECAWSATSAADVEAARAAGARPMLVPTPRTRSEEVAAAPETARDLADALDRLGFAPLAPDAAAPAGDSPARRCRATPRDRDHRPRTARSRPPATRPAPPASELDMTHVLAVRLDNDGDVLLAGPAIRALAAGADRVTLLCGPRGRQAARAAARRRRGPLLARAVDRSRAAAGRLATTSSCSPRGSPRWASTAR